MTSREQAEKGLGKTDNFDAAKDQKYRKLDLYVSKLMDGSNIFHFVGYGLFSLLFGYQF